MSNEREQSPNSEPPEPVWRVAPAGMFPAPAPTPVQSEMLLRRRQFLRGGFWAGLGVLVAGGLASAVDFLAPHDQHRFGSIIAVPAAKVPKPGDPPYYHQEGRFWLVNLRWGEGVPPEFRQFGRPAQYGGLLALYQRCTHLGCFVPWRPDFEFGGVTGWFRCPCHAQTYTKAGLRVFGPSLRSMDTFRITNVSLTVSVNTGRLLLGDSDDPQRAVEDHFYRLR